MNRANRANKTINTIADRLISLFRYRQDTIGTRGPRALLIILRSVFMFGDWCVLHSQNGRQSHCIGKAFIRIISYSHSIYLCGQLHNGAFLHLCVVLRPFYIYIDVSPVCFGLRRFHFGFCRRRIYIIILYKNKICRPTFIRDEYNEMMFACSNKQTTTFRPFPLAVASTTTDHVY